MNKPFTISCLRVGLEIVLLLSILQTIHCRIISDSEKKVTDCPKGFMTEDAVRKKSKLGFNIPKTLSPLGKGLHLMPEMKFTCSGWMKSILLGAKLETGKTAVYPEIQIWREVENTEADVVLLSSHTMILHPKQSFSPTVYFYHYFHVPISFSAGDFIGIYQPSDDSAVKLFYTTDIYDSPSMFLNDEISEPPIVNTTFCLSTLDVREGRHLLLRPDINVGSTCISGFLDYGTIKTKSHYLNPLTYHERQLRLFPQLGFDCRGVITKATFGAQVTINATGNLLPELQIWRSYDRGSFLRISSVPLSLNESKEINNLHQLYLNPPLQVEREDFIGVFQPEVKNSILMFLYQESSGPRNLLVASGIDPPSPSAASGVKDSEENDYPLITVEFDFITSVPSTLHTSASLSTCSDLTHGQSCTAMTTTVSTPPPSTTQPPTGPDSTNNNIVVIIVSALVGAVMILILVIAILVVWMCVKIQMQKRPNVVELVVSSTNPKHTGTRNQMTMSLNYDECVELKRNFSYGVVSPKQLKCVHTSLNPLYEVPGTANHNGNLQRDSLESSYETVQANPQEYEHSSPADTAGELVESRKYY